MIHNLDITKWPDTTFAKWAALIDQTPALDWNQKVIDPAKDSAHVPKLAASSATASRTTKM